MNEWWKFEVAEDVYERFAPVFSIEGKVCDWTCVLTKVLCSYATHIGVDYNTDVDTFMDEMLEATKGCSGYAKYVKFLILSHLSKVVQSSKCGNKMLESFGEKISGCKVRPMIYTWFLCLCGYQAGVLPNDIEAVTDKVRNMVINYKKTNSYTIRFPQQIVIATLAGSDALDILENKGYRTCSTKIVQDNPTRFKILLSSDIDFEKVSKTPVALDDLSKQILSTYSRNLPAQYYPIRKKSDLLNMFIHDMGKDLIDK